MRQLPLDSTGLHSPLSFSKVASVWLKPSLRSAPFKVFSEIGRRTVRIDAADG